jgi:hypothetical protein
MIDNRVNSNVSNSQERKKRTISIETRRKNQERTKLWKKDQKLKMKRSFEEIDFLEDKLADFQKEKEDLLFQILELERINNLLNQKIDEIQLSNEILLKKISDYENENIALKS